MPVKLQMGNITLVFPDGALADLGDPTTPEGGLRLLTKTLVERGLAEYHGGFLGGQWGYGTNYENDTFMMHSYCWCEEEDCPWCCGCTCPPEAFHYLVDGQEVTYEEWMDFFERECGEAPIGNPKAFTAWVEKARQVNQRRSIRHDPLCEFCRTGGPAATKGGGPGKRAPNFWHKPSGYKVWIYKWIGYDMEVENPSGVAWSKVLEDCLASIS